MGVLKPANIDDHWPLITRGLAAIQRKSPEPWTTDEIAEACRNRRAFLFVFPEGFVVFQSKVIERGRAVHVWVAYGEGRGLIRKYLTQAIGLARQIGACKITWQSSRSGYLRYLPEAVLNGNQYEIEL